MPSGAKKRKAAKKKKEQATNSSSTNNPHGNDDPKSQDERDSDVKIEKGCEAKKDLDSTHVSIQRVEHDKTSSSSSSSSSDDESQVSEKKSKGQTCNLGSEVASYSTEDISASVFSEEAANFVGIETLENVDSNSTVETVAVDNLVIPVLPVGEEVDISANNLVPDEFELGLEENEEKILPTSNGISGVEGSGNFTPSDITLTAETSNVAEKYQESEHHDNSEKQPLIASNPPPLQRTSLLSCCGLFEVFTDSGR